MKKDRITLITPPDIFENESRSILFMHLNDQDQETVSVWLANNLPTEDINIYFYSGENSLTWLFHAMAICEYRYIDLNEANTITTALSSYILGKKNTFYKIDNANLAVIFDHINQNKIINIETFLKQVFDDQNSK